MSSLPTPTQQKLEEIKAKVSEGYGFSDLMAENYEAMMLAAREVIGDCLGQELHRTDNGKRYDSHKKTDAAIPEKPSNTLVVTLNRAKGILQNPLKRFVKVIVGGCI